MGGGGVKAYFCTYQSLHKICEAQLEYNAPRFDLAIADEAHRTTGIAKDNLFVKDKVDFQTFHDADKLGAVKRLYMTATPRVYSEQSKQAVHRQATKKGLSYNVVDMTDVSVYGPLLHHVKFSEAVNAGELSDYRVIVLGIREDQLTPGVRKALEDKNAPAKVSQMELCRLLGTMLALNGAVEGEALPGKLSRSIAFASTIQRSKWFTDTVNKNTSLKRLVTTVMSGQGKRADLESHHLDGKSTALQRNLERRWLNEAPKQNQARMICNVKVFSEGVDVPALEAVTFLDPKQSHIDIVQAVGRVMRKAPGKTRGYIIVPVFISDGDGDIAELLEQRGDDYRHIGSVLRALQSHDERLAESPDNFVSVLTGKRENNQNGKDYPPQGPGRDPESPIEDLFTFKAVEPGIFAQVVASSGLGKPGQVTADEIARSVGLAAKRMENDIPLLDSVRQTLDLSDVKEKEVSTTAALILCNACLLHRRLQQESPMQQFLPSMLSVGRSQNPAEMLAEGWDKILTKDYDAVFRPALSIIENSPKFSSLTPAFQILAEGVANLSETVAELGYDHAGPLYHKILGSAASDGAFYTNNISALMLAGLALHSDLVDWSDWHQATKLRILDPACGTGTLLMAALKTIKDRIIAAQPDMPQETKTEVHKKLVENSIQGLDINYQATQLAASNLTLGAPTVDYDSMHIHTMRHGPQSEGGVKLGSLELLPEAVGDGQQPDLFGHTKQAPISTPYSSISKEIDIDEVDIVLMNPPFTNSAKRGMKYSSHTRKLMQNRELEIKHQIKSSDADASNVIDSNSISTYFIPLADALLHKEIGVLGTVLPTTTFTSTSVMTARKFLAERFHIDMVVTCHEPNQLNFSENTSIHESLLVCRRRGRDEDKGPTTFIALNHMPRNATEATDWLEAVLAGKEHKYHRTFKWPRSKIADGDWTPAQYYDGSLANLAQKVDDLKNLSPLGDLAFVESARQVFDVFKNPLKNTEYQPLTAFEMVWTHTTSERETMRSFSDFTTEPKTEKYNYAVHVLWPKASRMLIACRVNPQAIRVSSIFLPRPVLGQPFIPVTPLPKFLNPTAMLQAWCAYLNSTPAVLSFLNRRQKKLTYANYSLNQIRAIPVPDPEKTDLAPLVSAFNDLGNSKLLPWSKMNDCPTRAKLDDVVAKVLGLDPEILADWRQRIVSEPTVNNQKPAD